MIEPGREDKRGLNDHLPVLSFFFKSGNIYHTRG